MAKCYFDSSQIWNSYFLFLISLAFYDEHRNERIPDNLIQAQRDYSDVHTYELLIDPGKFVHIDWTETGGNVSSPSHNV